MTKYSKSAHRVLLGSLPDQSGPVNSKLNLKEYILTDTMDNIFLDKKHIIFL